MEEISVENRRALESRYRTTALVVAAQIVLTGVLVAAVWVFLAAAPPSSAVSRQTYTTLWVLIVFLALGAFLLRRSFFRWDKLKDIAVLKGVAGLLVNLQTNAVVLSLFATTLAFVGAAIAILTGEIFELLRAEFVALVVFAINFPRRLVWEKIVAGIEKV